ncbi:MAG: hypothetical protein H6567_01690 [Lewinellaceae bacterium]|nr:hypothetical protein [Lewinellaceae bacterium]
MFKNFISIFMVVLAVLMTTSVFSQNLVPCNCNATVKLETESCATHQSDHDIAFYIYDPEASNTSHLVKLSVNSGVIFENQVTLDSKGFYSSTIPFKFIKDSDILLEYTCDKDNNCVKQDAFHLETLPSFELLVQDATCTGVNDGIVSLDNDVANLMDIVWASGEKKKDVRNLAPGDYTITIYNKTNSCKINKDVKISSPAPLKVNFHTFNIGCINGNAKYLKSQVLGGTAPYSYDWDDNGINGYTDEDNIVFNSYKEFTLKVKDAQGCTLTAKATPAVTNVISYNVKDGHVISNDIANNGEYLFNLMEAADVDGGDIDQDGLDGSLYNITFYKNMEDANNNVYPLNYQYIAPAGTTVIAKIENVNDCIKTARVELAAASFCLEINEACDNDAIKELIPRNCMDSNIQLPSGGVWEIFKKVGYSEISDSSRLVLQDGKYYFDPTNGPGNYLVYYTPPGGARQFAPFDVQAIYPQVFPYLNLNCGNVSPLYIRVNPNGDNLTGPNIVGSFLIEDNKFFVIDTHGMNVGTDYTYTFVYDGIFDSRLTCSKTVTSVIQLAPYPEIDIINVPSSLCYEDRLALDVNVASTESVTYEWYKPSDRITPFSTLKNPVLEDAYETGYYIAKVIQENGCFAIDSEYVEIITRPSISCVVDASVTCFGGSDARAEVTVIDPSGTSSYSILWSNGSEEFVQENLSAGTYQVTVTNDRGCADTCSVKVNTPPAFNIDCTYGIANVSCFGLETGSNTVNSSGGTPPYLYSLDGINFSSQNTFSNLGAENYTVYIKDNIGCIDSCFFEITEPNILECILHPTDLSCFMSNDGIVSVEASGGVMPYRYLWNTGATTSEISGLPAGNYSVTITDANNCTSSCNIALTQPGKIQANLNPYDVCLDFDKVISVDITRTEGINIDNTKNSYDYFTTWNLSQSAQTIATGAVDSNIVAFTSSDSIKFTTYCLKEGVATIIINIEDQNGCTSVDSTDINIQSCVDLALRKTVIDPGVKYPGENVGHLIEVFNQGTVAVKDILIRDIMPAGYNFDSLENIAAITGNPYDWSTNPDGLYFTKIDQLLPGEKANLKIFLQIQDDFAGNVLVNRAEIYDFYSIISGNKVKHNPIDQDDFVDDGSKQVEVDDEICDDNNPSSFCQRTDDPNDEDKMDFDIVSLCTLTGTTLDESACVTSNLASANFSINSLDKSKFDPTGEGDGSTTDGDEGNLVAGIYNSYLNAMMDIDPITGDIKFANGNIQNNGVVLPNGDLLLKAGEDVVLYARLVSIDNCVAVSSMNLDFSIMPTINVEPISVVSLLGEENVCFEVAVDSDAEDLVKYQWQVKENGTFINILGAVEPDYCIPIVTLDNANSDYRVLISDKNSTDAFCTQTSLVARLLVEDDPKLACEDLINVSLDDDCLALITPSMVLEDDRFTNRITIIIKDDNGNIINNPIDYTTVHGTYTVHAVDSQTGNSCWSKIYVEDKLPPVIDCPEDVTTSCANNEPLIFDPGFYDSCDPSATIKKVSDMFHELPCGDSNGFTAYRELTYTAKDKYGNVSAPCVYRIYFKPVELGDVRMPQNIELSCTATSWDTNSNGYPDLSETGIPSYNSYSLAKTSPSDATKLVPDNHCKINIQYSDTKIPLCGNTFKILRTFNVLNWCNGEIRTHNQIIKISDNDGPSITCQNQTPFKIYTSRHKCGGDFTVPEPSVQDCNTTSWTVTYKLQDKYGVFDDNEPFVNDNVVVFGGVTTIVDLPVGSTMIKYTVVDVCGNANTCTALVNVVDEEIPIPVCDEHTVVSLDQNGNARLYAKSIDDGSHDNCTSLTYALRRMSIYCPNNAPYTESYDGNLYYEYVDFCCSDQFVPNQQVELLVSDQSGNQNVCMTNVEIQNKSIPKITCPNDVTVDCSDDISMTALGQATFTAGCDVYYLDVSPDVVTEYTCGEKQILRTWFVKSNIGDIKVTNCTQVISVKNLTPFDLNTVTFPSDVVLVNNCKKPGDFGPDLPSTGGYPQYTKTGCSQIGISYSDQVFDIVEDACFKILRKWTVIDWCTFNENDESSFVTHTQVIKVIDTEKPTATCDPKTFYVDQQCKGTVSLDGKGYDSCTPESDLNFDWVMKDVSGSIVNSGNTKYINTYLDKGSYTIVWNVEDKCGNTNSCDQLISVVDTLAPQPYCITDITTVLMPSTLSVGIWAKDYDRGATDNCTEDICFTFGTNRPVNLNLKHYFKVVNGVSVIATEAEYNHKQAELWDPVSKSSSRLFDCDDIGLHDINIVSWDEDGNYSYCTVKIRIQDNTGKCGQSRPSSISGIVSAIDEAKVADLQVSANLIESNEPFSTTTDVNGVYTFEYLPSESTYKIEPQSTDDYLNGVSTLDLVMIQRHILGIESFDQWNQYIAADVNKDNKVSVSDISELRKMLLGINTKFSNAPSWRYHHGGTPTGLFSIEESSVISAKEGESYTADFKAIKLGDLNNSVVINNTLSNNTASRTQNINVYMQDSKEFDRTIDFYLDPNASASGVQLELVFDHTAKPSSIEGLPADNFRWIQKGDKQILRIISTEEKTGGDLLFRLIFDSEVAMPLEQMVITNKEFDNVIVTNDLTEKSISLQTQFRSSNETHLIVYQNNPNPYKNMTSVKFYNPSTSDIYIQLIDSQGKIRFEQNKVYDKGYHTLDFNTRENNIPNGVSFLRISNSNDTKIVKMIQVE